MLQPQSFLFWALKNVEVLHKITGIIIILGIYVVDLFLTLYCDLSFELAFGFLILDIDGLKAHDELPNHHLNKHHDHHSNEGATLVKGLASYENDEKGYQDEEIKLLVEEFKSIEHLGHGADLAEVVHIDALFGHFSLVVFCV